jgi:hypothetical protein
MPTHFTNGVSNVGIGNPLYEFGMMDPTKWHVFFDDFNHEPLSTEWTITATSGGIGTSAISTPDVAGGQARITTAADENDGLFAQTIGEVFLLADGKKAFVKTRISVGDAIQSDWIVGLHSTDTTPLDATMRFAFISEDGAATVLFNSDDNTTDDDSSTIATLSDDTFITLAAYWDGVDKIACYANDVLINTMTSANVPGAEMAVGFGYLNGAAGAETADIDYIFVANER